MSYTSQNHNYQQNAPGHGRFAGSGMGGHEAWPRNNQTSARRVDQFSDHEGAWAPTGGGSAYGEHRRPSYGPSLTQQYQTAGNSQWNTHSAQERPKNQIPGPPGPQRSFSDGKQQANMSFNQGRQVQHLQGDRTKPLNRSRILQAPDSPEKLSWDNPFPTFPNLQDSKDSKHSIDKHQESQRSGSGGQDDLSTLTAPLQSAIDSNADYNDGLGIENHSQKSGFPSNVNSQGIKPNQNTFRHEPMGRNENSEPLRQRSDASSPNSYGMYQNRAADTSQIAGNRDLNQRGFASPGVAARGADGLDSALRQDYPMMQSQQYPVQTLYGRTPQSAPEDTRGTHGDYFETYDSSYDTQGGAFNSMAAPELEDMPNFDAVPDHGHGQELAGMVDKQLHIAPQQTSPEIAFSGGPRGRPSERGLQTNWAGAPAPHRSRSQPNFRGAPQAHPNYGDRDGHAPPMPPLFNQHQNYGKGGHSGQQRPSEPYFAGPGRQPPIYTSGNNPSFDARTPRPQNSNGFPNSNFRPRGQANPTMMTSPNLSATGGKGSPGQFNRVAPGPDALPQHPTPVRPGLAQQSPANQAPKAAPVRQNTFNPPPRSNTAPAQNQSTPSSSKVEDLGLVSQQEIQRLRHEMQTNPTNQQTQLLLAKKLVETASIMADNGGKADVRTRNKNREKLLLEAQKIAKKLVSSGNTEAMFFLADCHGRGVFGLSPDPKEAFNLYQSAAKLGHAPSAYRVAVCCEMGQDEGGGTRRDPLKAIQWYKRAATLGDTPAMYKMGMIQLKGLLGQSRNPREAITWLKRAAERADEENPHALHELGLLYENASGIDSVIRDEEYARQLFLQAAELNYKFSQYRLGAAYEYGSLNCPIDPRQSIAWYSRAAAQEEHQSELALSGWYLTGTEGIIQQSDTEAYLWARKAAQAGLAKAEYAMGYFTEVGIGAPADLEAAKRWYWRAASQNYPKARERLEELRKGGARMQKSRVSRSAVNRSEGDCILM